MTGERQVGKADVRGRSSPVGLEKFARLMDGIGYFEASPLIAVGVSGGADSMVLLRLADVWARARNGRVIGLTVDHGLRTGSAEEADWVARELHTLGIEHHILAWRGEKPVSAIQDKARRTRRRLMLDWCRNRGVLHLCLGHHANDQVETFMMRMARSGENAGQSVGLAGMSQVREHAHARIVRPLLAVTKERLEATLLSMKQDWLNDPSNDREQFERVRVRKAASEMDAVGGGLSAVADSIRQFGDIRRDLERLGARALSASTVLYPAGYARLDTRKLAANGDSAARYALSRLIMTVGGLRYPVATGKLERLQRSLECERPVQKQTVGGCLFSGSEDGVLIVREERNLPSRQHLAADAGSRNIHWDNRFRLSLGMDSSPVGTALSLGKLGARGWDRLVQIMPELRRHPVPLSARYALPALYCEDEIIAVSHLTKRFPESHSCCAGFEKAVFSSPEPALGGTFSVALADFCTISDEQNATMVTDERIEA